MAERHLRSVIGHIRKQIGSPDSNTVTDGQLLERFRTERDELAFEVLVRRHGPMVLNLCRRVLGDAHAAEDAFQATFLILVRKAPSIGKEQALARWLYQVAFRVALRSRAQAARRTASSLSDDPVDAAANAPQADWSEVRPVLDEEIRHLPAKYRTPIILHYLEGKAYTQVAQEIGCPKGTVAIRLSRARAMLHRRLVRRGVTLSAAALTAFLGDKASAALPSSLVDATIQASLWFTGQHTATAGVVSARAVPLAQGMMKTMMLTRRMKIATVVLLLLGLIGSGIGWSVHQALADPPAPTSQKGSANSPDKRARVDRSGDPLPAGVVARLGTVRFRHGADVRAVAYSPDGKTLASGSKDGTCKLWDAATGKERRTLKTNDGRGYYVSAVEFSPDGKTLATVHCRHPAIPSQKAFVRLWTVDTGKEMRTLKHDGHRIVSVAFAPDGKTLACGGSGSLGDFNHTILLYRVATGEVIHALFGPEGLSGLAIAPDGKTLATAGAGAESIVRLWDMATGKEIWTLKGHQKLVHAVAYAPDSKTLVSSQGNVEEPAIGLWDVATGKQIRTLASRALKSRGSYSVAFFYAVAFSPDGRTLVSGGHDGTVRLWEVATGQEIHAHPLATVDDTFLLGKPLPPFQRV